MIRWVKLSVFPLDSCVARYSISFAGLKLRLNEIFEDGQVTPAVMQIERALRIYDMGKNCGRAPVTIKDKGIAVVACTAIGYAVVRQDPAIVALEKNLVAKREKASRQEECLKVIELHEEDARRIDALDKNRIRSCMQPDKQGKVLVWSFDRLRWRREERVLQIEANILRWIWNYAGMTGVSSEAPRTIPKAGLVIVGRRAGRADRPAVSASVEYGTEKFVEEASGIPRRDELFITTKLPLKNAGLDYFDLVCELWLIAKTIVPSDDGTAVVPGTLASQRGIVWPENPDSHGQVRLDETGNFNDTWAEMKKVLANGKVKAIGLSNFSVRRTYLCMGGGRLLNESTEHCVNMTGQEKELYLGIRMHSYLVQNEC
ncbi:uncharacterized protein HD556DRAFT_1302655 [Suillus plorans]|uniref:Uncharacterized protein n=1 Tax=Suillus plorans TaxID=116603 RepID=A0A9P7E3L8_9AGAM|nr:uncharacterized protein HD556DRAFT_1302655 [Suillus plorans]KAG1810329.1 hypothetical protein HD556DRAFT_1302655 [Suillus plorans]